MAECEVRKHSLPGLGGVALSAMIAPGTSAPGTNYARKPISNFHPAIFQARWQPSRPLWFA
jgi:hypothetical protein